MAHILWGSKETYELFVKSRDFFANDPIFQNDSSYFDLERAEMMEHNFRIMNRLYKSAPFDVDYKTGALLGVSLNGGLPTSLHHLMFELSIRYLGDDE